MALISTLAPDPGADIAAQAQLMRQQKLAQLLANPPKPVEIDMGGDGGKKSDNGSPEGNSILAKMLSEDVSKTAGPSVASFDAPVSTGSNSAPLNIAGLGSAFPLISKFEGFRSKPYWDVNHYRVGFGSDTITTPDGQVVEVKPGMSVSRSDAERDLNRRIGEFQGGIQNDIGKEAWERLPEGTKAALTSVAYNYGAGWGRKIPSLLTAARSGDVSAIAQAIESRRGDNQGVNAKRRLLEAQIAAGGAIPSYQAPAAAEAPYKVASLGFTAPPRRQPIAPMQPAPQPASAPAPQTAPQTPPLPTMVGAPMPVNATPIGATGGAALTDAPMPPSRSASGVDEIIKRQAASARPALNAPQEFDLFDEIGRGLEELFGGGGGDAGGQSEGVQVAGGGEQYYPMQPTTGHGLLGNLLTDAFRTPVPIPSEVQALARSPKQSDRLAYQLMVHGNELGGTQAAMMTALYKEARDREQAGENRFGAPRMDQYGNLVQEGPNGQLHILRQAEKPIQPYSQPHMDSVGNLVQEGPDGQVHVIRQAEKPPSPISVGEGTTLFDPTTRQPIYTAPKANGGQDKIQTEINAREQEVVKRGLNPKDARVQDYILTGKFPREDATPLTATDKKAILEADEMVETSQNAMTAIQRAKEASKKAWGFKGAGPISSIAAPFSEGAQNTVDLDNIVTSDALESLKATFGGNPTEGERAILLQIQGSSALPDAERQRIYDRAEAAIQRRLEFNKRRAQDMRGGSYYDQGHNPNNQGPAAGSQPSSGGSPAPAKKIRYDANGNIVQ